jgi:RHS repeat-associated protein
LSINTNYNEVLEKYFAQARLYDPLTKRFIAKDEAGYSKISEPITLNLYVYGSQNPLANVDPTGRAGERVADSNRSRGYFGKETICSWARGRKLEFIQMILQG